MHLHPRVAEHVQLELNQLDLLAEHARVIVHDCTNQNKYYCICISTPE